MGGVVPAISMGSGSMGTHGSARRHAGHRGRRWATWCEQAKQEKCIFCDALEFMRNFFLTAVESAHTVGGLAQELRESD